MKKQELLKYLDDDLLEKLFGFCYARTRDSYEAEALCSDIVFALVKAAQTNGELTNVYSFVWKVARNVYADFSKNRRKNADAFCDGDTEEVLQSIADDEDDDEDNREELLRQVYRRIAFLTRAYREVMIMYYIDGLSTAEIAKQQHTGESAVRQRLFSARQKLKSEVKKMAEMEQKPLALDKIDYVIWGDGRPAWGDPRNVCSRMFSKHIVWLCKNRPMRASEIAEELNVPTVYVEEELDILTKGENGKYGLLRRMENGKYALNFILIDKDTIEKAHALYIEHIPKICEIILSYIETHREAYLSFPYLNRKVDLNLILWQQIVTMARAFSDQVSRILAEQYFSHEKKVDRPFSVYGYVDNGKHYGGGVNGVNATNVCGFSEIHLTNISTARVKPHFYCGLNVADDPQIQLALRAIDGLEVSTLPEVEKEHAAKAVRCGYLYRDGDMLYTKILVCAMEDEDRLWAISEGLRNGFFAHDVQAVAEKVAAWIKKAVPDDLLGEWRHANSLASLPVTDSVIEALIEKGVLTPPEDGIGAEGCWMSVMK